MGRTKGSKNKPKPIKVVKITDTKIQPIKDVDKYEVRRLYWYMRALENQIQADPLSVSPERYQKAMLAFTDRMRAYKQRLADEKAKSRMDKKKTQRSSTESSGSAGIGQDGQVDLGARISTDNPIT